VKQRFTEKNETTAEISYNNLSFLSPQRVALTVWQNITFT